jgi:uncharacterized membrane protein YfhO
MLVVQRSYLPIYTAEVDGAEVEIEVANMHRMAVEVPAGEHEILLAVNRRSVLPAFAVSLLGMVLLALKVRRTGFGGGVSSD